MAKKKQKKKKNIYFNLPLVAGSWCEFLTLASSQLHIRLIDLMSAFFILGIGLGLSALAFLVEKVICFRGRPKTVMAVSCGEPTTTLESQEQPSSAIEILE
jgi:hypothetical protein